MSSRTNSRTHVFRATMQYPGEQRLIADLVRPGMRVLDVGTAATGRSAHLLRAAGGKVTSIEINEMALMEFATHGDRHGIQLAAADICQLPFLDGCFDLVLVAFHGLDYLLTEETRIRAYQEVGRVLNKNGVFVFNAFNRLGVMFSPSGLFDKNGMKMRLKHILSGRCFKPTLVDMYNMEMHQALPSTIIQQVHKTTDLQFQFSTNLNGNTRNLNLITLFAIGPYYVFLREG